MLVAVAVGCVGLALFCVALAVLAPRRDPTAERLGRIGGAGGGFDIDAETATVWERLVQPLAAGALDRVGALLPARLGAHFEDQLVAAGRPVGSGAFSAVLVLLPAALVLLTATAGAREGAAAPGAIALAAVAVGAFGVAAPVVWLRGRITRRQQRIARALPDTFDLVVVSVEAGLGLEAALARVAESTAGPLAEELRRVLADMNLGMGRRRALQGLTARVRLPAVRALVSAIVQADQTGMGIGQVLRAQGEHLRTQRRQSAEERAMKAPLKMLFPLVFFIFPSLFVVLLGPAMLSLMQTLGGR